MRLTLPALLTWEFFKTRLQQMIDDLRKEPNNGLANVLAAGDPEKNTFASRQLNGIPVDVAFVNSLKGLTLF